MTETPRFTPTRRAVAAALAGFVPAARLLAAPAANTPRPGFLWGTAISGHQSEGNNVHSDAWFLENLEPTAFEDASGDACDSYHRYGEDLDIAASLDLNCYRFGIEWSRIEPEPGRFSIAALDHYKHVLEGCHRRGLLPMVTFNHFTVPLWFADRGGYEVADGADLFARFAERTTAALGPLIGMATTFNEANILLLRKALPRFATDAGAARARNMIETARRRRSAPAFSSYLFADPDRVDPILRDAHAKAYQAIKAGPGDFPVGLTLSMQQIDGVGPNAAQIQAGVEAMIYGEWIDAARHSDFVGVQTYSRLRFNDDGLMPAPEGAELTAMGYEYYPAAVGATLRYAARHIDKPVYLTETGIGTDDDRRRIAFIDATLNELRRCIADGIDVKGYIYWSLLDNFEWTRGYAPHFGLVAVDRHNFARTPKPSARHFGAIARRAHGGRP
ncbi:aryl-beta-glucosidase [Sphingopyxis sp. YR583]|uniref:glycoside hydrolase family 1 protein n=1 Tax=Sphingopyxis sp. YR583 TaxID=1881047 RepID=UPI0008A7D7FE|nr:family 1 glycosylhydrolase [Sphingopyxis sp. YR583]SEH13847.1 aryl-beta-glucosidase [Sphingopyxis sp. YR583]